MTTTEPADAALAITGLTVSFDGFVAVDDVTLTVPTGDVRFLIGPNGAGKTTIIDAVTGMVPAEGSAVFEGEELIGRNVHSIARLGIGRTFQTATVFEDLSVAQNLDIARSVTLPRRTFLRQRHGLPERVAEVLETVGLQSQADRPAGELAHGQKQWLEIGMLLVQDCRLLLLDEPVAGMSQDERQATGDLLHRIAADRTVLVVEHDMDFLRRFARSVTVLSAGAVLCEGTVAEVQADPRVQEVYLGRAALPDPGPAAAPIDLTTATTGEDRP